MPPVEGQNTQEQLWQRLLDSLKLADRIGWLNAPIVAYAFWPEAPSRLKYAERLLANLVKRGWFKPHKMPFRQRSCYTATQEGRRQWLLSTRPEETGKFDPSDMKTKSPGAASTYLHDTRAASALLWLAKGDMDRIIFDREIIASEFRKRPDGIVLDPEIHGKLKTGHWVETENAKKTGPNMRKQVTEMIEITMEAGKGGLWMKTQKGAVMPKPLVLLVVPEGYNTDSFCQRVQKQIAFNDRGEELHVGFIEDTKAGFKAKGEKKITRQGQVPMYEGKVVEVW